MKNVILGIILFLGHSVFSQTNYFSLANMEMNNKNYVKAEEYYLVAMQQEPLNYNILSYYGFCKHKQKYYQEADSIFKISVSKDSNNAQTYWFMGQNYTKMKKDSLTVWAYKKFINKEKIKGANTRIAYKNVGNAYYRILISKGLNGEQTDDLIFHLEQVEKLEPSDLDIPQIQSTLDLIKKKRPDDKKQVWILKL